MTELKQNRDTRLYIQN